MQPFVSIILICESWNHFLEESLPYYIDLNYDQYEILVFSSIEISKECKKKFDLKKIRFIVDAETKNKPALKRDLAIKYSKGEYYAFIDDDAWPEKNWLKNAVSILEDKNVVAVGGPGITPSTASDLEKAAGLVSASLFGGYENSYRFIPAPRREVVDLPSCNFIVKKDDFISVNGFDSNFYPGEDTKLCLDLINKTGKKIIYDPEVLIYHHKRPLFYKHLIQNGRFGEHRGHFARILPKTSAIWFYFIPSLFSLGLLIGPIFIVLMYVYKNLIFVILAHFYFISIILYIILIIANSIWIYIKSKNLKITLYAALGVFLTHFWYGLKFLKGYFKNKLNDEYGRIEN